VSTIPAARQLRTTHHVAHFLPPKQPTDASNFSRSPPTPAGIALIPNHDLRIRVQAWQAARDHRRLSSEPKKHDRPIVASSHAELHHIDKVSTLTTQSASDAQRDVFTGAHAVATAPPLTDDMLYQMHVPQVSRSIVNTPLSSGAINAVSFAHDSHIANFTVPNSSTFVGPSFISDFASMAQVEDFNDDGLCKHFGCVDDAIAGGFCATHALGRRNLSSAHASSALAPADAMCKAFGCVEAAVVRGMCSAHLSA